MRKTVDEKLDETLTQRLNSSFETVSKQLKDVYKSLGEMKELSSSITDSVGSLNRVLTNVKARGTWAEVQLQNILDQTIANMYETNVQTNPNYNGRVEFAVKIPNGDNDEFAYLPIDSKFPMEDYARLAAASEAGDVDALAQAKKALEVRVKDEAKLIKQYICPPNTTPFAIMYLATEGLYAQIISSKRALPRLCRRRELWWQVRQPLRRFSILLPWDSKPLRLIKRQMRFIRCSVRQRRSTISSASFFPRLAKRLKRQAKRLRMPKAETALFKKS